MIHDCGPFINFSMWVNYIYSPQNTKFIEKLHIFKEIHKHKVYLIRYVICYVIFVRSYQCFQSVLYECNFDNVILSYSEYIKTNNILYSENGYNCI